MYQNSIGKTKQRCVGAPLPIRGKPLLWKYEIQRLESRAYVSFQHTNDIHPHMQDMHPGMQVQT